MLGTQKYQLVGLLHLLLGCLQTDDCCQWTAALVQGEESILRVTRNIDVNALRSKLKELAAAAASGTS
jgi:hypothetical protein